MILCKVHLYTCIYRRSFCKSFGSLSFPIFIKSDSSGGLSLPLIIVLLITDLGSIKKSLRIINNSDKFIKIYIKNSNFSQLF